MASNNKYTSIIFGQIYPIVEAALAKYDSKFKDHMARFFNTNHELIFDIGPYDRIYYTEKDKNDLFQSMHINEDEILKLVENTFYYNWASFNPPCAKEPYVVVLMCAIRYYLKKNKTRDAELTAIYLCFSGKFYASLHTEFFRKFPPSKYRSVMDYVINNMLSGKFDIKNKGSLFGAIESLCQTYLNTYKDRIGANLNDEDVAKQLIQQLRDRERSFLRNIANLYYEAYNNKYYLNYETDSLDEDDFRLTSNDANDAARITEATMNYLTSNYVSVKLCNSCQDKNVKALDVKNIMENILGDKNNLPEVKRVINILICDYKRAHPNQKVSNVDFIDYTITAKPNTKDKYLIELKETIENWLKSYSERFRLCKRPETIMSFRRSILMYFGLVINTVAQKL